MHAACKQCGKHFRPKKRADTQYCSGRCRIAAYRWRHEPPPLTFWYDDDGRKPQLSDLPPRRRKYRRDSSYIMVTTEGLSNRELGERLLEIADDDDDGEPKTGRRYYYLALSHGYIEPDMSDTEEGKKSRDAAYARVTNVLGILRKQGRLPWHMVLDLTRELTEWQTFASPREARAHLRRIYDEDRWLGQPKFPVLVVEKDTMVRNAGRCRSHPPVDTARSSCSTTPPP
jgi:hypothetical protein